MHVCMYVFMYGYMHVCMYVCMYNHYAILTPAAAARSVKRSDSPVTLRALCKRGGRERERCWKRAPFPAEEEETYQVLRREWIEERREGWHKRMA